MICFLLFKRLKTCQDFRVVLVGIILWFLPTFTEGCWGETAPKYGDMTRDYDLLAGDDLILNCTLNSNYVQVDPQDGTTYYVNSSYLMFRKGSRLSSNLVHILDGLTSQIRIPTANPADSGIYHCELAIPEVVGERLVCSSKVSVGYPPKPVKNFKCISMYYENLTCTWDIEDTGVQTKYTLSKHHFFSSFFESPQLQPCPAESANNTFCQWTEDTDPPFEPKEEVFTFILQGNNSLGSNTDTFTIKHSEIFVPNHPESLKVVAVSKQQITLNWSPPKKMKNRIGKPHLKYEMWIQEMTGEETEIKVVDVGVDVFSYTVSDLIPHMTYNFSLRCRSKFASENNMWSPHSAVQNRTISDVPYHVPAIIPEAYELHHFDGYRTVTLYWQSISQKYYNGENFTYHIVCSYNDSDSLNMVSKVESVNVTTLSATFDFLREDCAYRFNLYSMNNQGLSKNYQTLILDAQNNIPELPEEITAISHDLGHYELSWKPPRYKDGIEIVDYVVFWCPSLKPWLSRCEGPIQWLNTSLETNKVTLNLSDSSTNFQFAVVSRTAKTSSGMKWATCIVPFKAALGKISNVIVEPKSSTSLKVIWRLDCAAQKAVVKKFEIVYCEVNEQKQCEAAKKSVEVMESSVENYILPDLKPFSNYSVIVRAYNLAGLPSEESDPKIQTTLQGAPADPPQDIKVVPTSNASLHIMWRPPLHPNGIITHYRVQYNNKIKIVKVESHKMVYEIYINDLLHYVNYSVRIQACVDVHFCSRLSEPVTAQTDIGVPGVMDPPRVEAFNSTFLKVSWNRPFMSNGPINFYEVLWKEVKNENVSQDNKIEYKVVAESLSTLIKISCSSFEDGGVKYSFSIRSANVKKGVTFYGPVSEPTQARACLLSQGLAMIVGAAIGGTLALAVVMLLIYKLIKWMSDKIHQVKSITVRLPKGLDGPETNPLNNYENFKNGLLQQTLNTAVIGRLSYTIDDTDNKNRHGSGSSQYSYSSTDELLYRNGKCTKFARKPSGESSGCSSMSSNHTRIHPSSECSTESDFMTPPSPDVFADHTNHKAPLPIVLEDKDSVTLEDIKNPSRSECNKEVEQCNNISELVLKIEQPSSKFGVSGCETSLPPCWVNSLAFYSVNLSNSEPSVTEVKDPVHVCMPYSKIGFAKSSGDILGLTPSDFSVGYSRIGVLPPDNDAIFHSFAAQAKKYNNTVNGKYMNGIVFIPDKQNEMEVSITENQDFCKSEKGSDKNGMNMPSLISVTYPHTEKEINEDSGYIKFRRAGPLAVKPGYVPFSDVSNFGKTAYPLLTLPVDEVPRLGLGNAELFSVDCKNYDEESGNETFPQKVVEYNPDAVAVIFNNSLGINMSPALESEGKQETESQADEGALPENLIYSGYGDGFSSVKSESDVMKPAATQPDDCESICIDFSSPASDDNILTTIDGIPQLNSTAQSELKSQVNLDLCSGNSRGPVVANSFHPEMDAPAAVTSHHLDNKISARNGYVPVSALSNTEANQSVPKSLQPEEKSSDHSADVNSVLPQNSTDNKPFLNSAPESPSGCVYKVPHVKRTSSDRTSRYKIYPMLNDIPKYEFNGTCKSDSFCTAGESELASENNKTAFNFNPLRKSEFCEV